RMDDRKQRIVIDADGGDGIKFFGWEVADAAALDAFAGHLEAQGIRVARGSRALADERRAADLCGVHDPGRTRARIFHGGEGGSRSAPAATSPASAPARSGSATSCCTSSASRT